MAAKIALIIATVLHDGGSPIVISGPEVPYEKQREIFKAEYAGERTHPKFARVELIGSRRGKIKHQSLISPKEAKRRLAEIARQVKEVEALENGTSAPEAKTPENETPPGDSPPPEGTTTA